jgi:hypothetical protein
MQEKGSTFDPFGLKNWHLILLNFFTGKNVSVSGRKGRNMRNFSIQSVGNQAVITVDLSFINIESLNRLFERLRTEQLIQKADFSDEITKIGTEIKQSWWQKNQCEL